MKKATQGIIIGLVVFLAMVLLGGGIYYVYNADSGNFLGFSRGGVVANKTIIKTPVNTSKESLENDAIIVTTEVPDDQIVNLNYAADFIRLPIVAVDKYPDSDTYIVANEGGIFFISDKLKNEKQTDLEYAKYFTELMADYVEEAKKLNNGPLIRIDNINKINFTPPEIIENQGPEITDDILVDALRGVFQDGMLTSPGGMDIQTLRDIAIVQISPGDYIRGVIYALTTKKPHGGDGKDERQFKFNWKTGKLEPVDDKDENNQNSNSSGNANDSGDEPEICEYCPSGRNYIDYFDSYFDGQISMDEIVRDIEQEYGVTTYTLEQVYTPEAYSRVFIDADIINDSNIDAANTLYSIIEGMNKNMTFNDFQNYWNANQTQLQEEYKFNANTAEQINQIVNNLSGDSIYKTVDVQSVFIK